MGPRLVRIVKNRKKSHFTVPLNTEQNLPTFYFYVFLCFVLCEDPVNRARVLSPLRHKHTFECVSCEKNTIVKLWFPNQIMLENAKYYMPTV